MKIKYKFFINYLLITIIFLFLKNNFLIAQKIIFNLSKGDISVNTKGLILSFGNQKLWFAITNQHELFAEPKNISLQDDLYTIEYECIDVQINKKSDDEIKFIFYSKKDQLIKWPIIKENSALNNFIIPQAEGLFIPKNDETMRSVLSKEIFDHSHMLPFVGLIYTDVMLTLIHHDPYRSLFEMYAIDRGAACTYDFRKRDQYPCFSISIIVSEPSLLGSAQCYRKLLQEKNNIITLHDKIKLNKNIEKLAGAPHIYLWGTGRTMSFLDQLEVNRYTTCMDRIRGKIW